MPASLKRVQQLVENIQQMDPDSQLQAVRDIKNGIIGNRRKKTAFSSAGAVPRLVEILRGAPGAVPPTVPQSEVVVQAIAALGSFAFGSVEGNATVMVAGAFPLLKQLLYSSNHKIVAGSARTIKIILEGNPLASQQIFRRNQDDTPPVEDGPAQPQQCGVQHQAP